MSNAGQIQDFHSGTIGACDLLSQQGHQLQVQSSLAFPLAGIVRVEIDNRMWMGEVCACESALEGFIVEIRVESTLNDVASVEELASRFRHERTIKPKGDAVVPVVSTRRDIV